MRNFFFENKKCPIIWNGTTSPISTLVKIINYSFLVFRILQYVSCPLFIDASVVFFQKSRLVESKVEGCRLMHFAITSTLWDEGQKLNVFVPRI